MKTYGFATWLTALFFLLVSTGCNIIGKQGDAQNPLATENESCIYLGDANPNPMHFGGSTSIDYSIKDTSDPFLIVTNCLEQEVYRVNLDSHQGSIAWNGLDSRNRQCGEGVYFYKLTSNNQSVTKKLLLFR
ncbi:MAG: T9SS type A sorting domain-containing protein [Candidatus Cloacimonetes bacterium]|nr:T9SS type A sorting domain-containing protein [Candidatus Cloacimonadota bacterium]